MTNQRFSGVDALTYDQSVSDWPGEIDFYLKFANIAKSKGQAVLDIACGTGRVTVPLAKTGVGLIGMDLAEDMLAVAQQKTRSLVNVRWVQGDMRTFDLNEKFGFVIIPAHSFQFMLTPQAQVECLHCIREHLISGGLLVIHIAHDQLSWLDENQAVKDPPFKVGRTWVHPQTGARMRTQSKWVYKRHSQTATFYKIWEEIGENDIVINRRDFEPMPMHVIFPFEMEHLLARVGLHVLNVYGDFEEHPFADDSPDMIWLAGKSE